MLDVCSWLFAGLVLFTLVVRFAARLGIVCCLWWIVLITCGFGVGYVLIVFVAGWFSAALRWLGFRGDCCFGTTSVGFGLMGGLCVV